VRALEAPGPQSGLQGAPHGGMPPGGPGGGGIILLGPGNGSLVVSHHHTQCHKIIHSVTSSCCWAQVVAGNSDVANVLLMCC
jgi:hypothetical protein